MSEFKPGDTIVCADSSWHENRITEGKEYQITQHNGKLKIIDDTG